VKAMHDDRHLRREVGQRKCRGGGSPKKGKIKGIGSTGEVARETGEK